MTLHSTESRHPQAEGLHRKAAVDVLDLLVSAQAAAIGAVRPALAAIGQAAGAIAERLSDGGRLCYAGAGSSGLMALSDCLELAGTFGIPVDRTPMLFAGGADALLHMRGSVEDDATAARQGVHDLGLGRGDAVVVVSASGTTPYALAVAEAARQGGAFVVGVANVAGSPLLALSDVSVLLDTGAEMVAGSTRMGAGTAQKVALNALSVLVGIRLGHVHDGYMVNLVADNRKLLGRAERIVGAVAGVGPEVAGPALSRSGGRVKEAVLIAHGMAPEAAVAALGRAGGHLARALDELSD